MLSACLQVVIAAFVLLFAVIASAQDNQAAPSVSGTRPRVTFEGFAEFNLNHFDYPQNFYRNRSKGPTRDSRTVADLSKLAMFAEGTLPSGIFAGAELEFRHAGLESENETNFYDPFNHTDHAHGMAGGIILNELYVARSFGDDLIVFLGRIPVVIGYLSTVKTPTDYFGSSPTEAETNLIPDDWTELGVGMEWRFALGTSATEIVNGLDSSGFGSQRWIAHGRQGRYGEVKFTDPALVERIDLKPFSWLKAGVAYYYGDTSRNRPTADLARECPEGSSTGDQAPCGYTPAPVKIVDAHASFHTDRWRGQALYLWGKIHNAGAINVANIKDQSNIPERYSPVGSEARGRARAEMPCEPAHWEADRDPDVHRVR